MLRSIAINSFLFFQFAMAFPFSLFFIWFETTFDLMYRITFFILVVRSSPIKLANCKLSDDRELAERLWRVTPGRLGSIPRRSNLSLVIGFRLESLLTCFPLGLVRHCYAVTRLQRVHIHPNTANKKVERVIVRTWFFKKIAAGRTLCRKRPEDEKWNEPNTYSDAEGRCTISVPF